MIATDHRQSRQPSPTSDADSRADSRADADSRSSFFSNRGSRRRQPTPTAALTSGAAADVLSVPREVFLEVPDHWTSLISER